MMLCLVSTESDPYFNLAAEEVLFKSRQEPLLFLYSNQPSVVLGKHQNALAEINYRFIRDNNIPVVRRISGGGAVFHDLGNLNFSFHLSVDDTSKISYRDYQLPVVNLLRSMEFAAELGQRNDILIDGLKVSGHAAHVFRKRVLSHGTLLIDSNKTLLSEALRGEPSKYSGKAISSVRSRVANLADFQPGLTVDALCQLLIGYFQDRGEVRVEQSFTPEERQEIETLANGKYRTWDWNFGYSPAYIVSSRFGLGQQNLLEMSVRVEKGKIVEARIESMQLSIEQKNILASLLEKCPHHEEALIEAFSGPEIQYLPFQVSDFIENLF